MKKWWFASLIAVAAMILWAGPAGAKWFQMASSQSGMWLISDQLRSAGTDCTDADVLLVLKRLQNSSRGQTLIKRRQVQVCCAGRTFREVSLSLISPDMKNLHTYRMTRPARPAKAGTVAAFMVDFVCRRVGAPPPGPQPVPPQTPPPTEMPPIDGSGGMK